jgi:hypothetical protein
MVAWLAESMQSIYINLVLEGFDAQPVALVTHGCRGRRADGIDATARV